MSEIRRKSCAQDATEAKLAEPGDIKKSRVGLFKRKPVKSIPYDDDISVISANSRTLGVSVFASDTQSIALGLADPDPFFEVEFINDVRIPTGDDGVTLSGDLYRPIGAEVVPALVVVLPYRKDSQTGIDNGAKMRWFASRGYACVLVDFRGTGSSDGDQRPPFDPGEADDGVAAVEWVATQRWCTGSVGMWGMSYGAIMALRTASRRPPHLKAIVPAMGALDLERDFVHPSGSHGSLAALADWGPSTLLNQLMPPLEAYGTAEQQRRWHRRLHNAEPWLMDLSRHQPGHPIWRGRAIDPSEITVPAFCIAGWRDLFCDASIAAYEKIRAPKRLLVGPWMHTAPDESPFDPVDYCRITFPWWEYWLKDVDNGIMEEPQVTLFEQGHLPQWRQFPSWPPPAKKIQLAASGRRTLMPCADSTRSTPIATRPNIITEYESDPTVGALSGLSGMPTAGFGLPLDQHDDDTRSLTATSEAIPEDVVLVGRPIVTVGSAPGSTFKRIVVRLTDVDLHGQSKLITVGVISCAEPANAHTVRLAPTLYRLPAGHRLRVALSDADFPRLWPAADSPDEQPPILRLTRIEMCSPVVADTEGRIVTLPVPERPDLDPDDPPVRVRPHWITTRDLVNDYIEIRFGGELAFHSPNEQHCVELIKETTARIERSHPEPMRARCVTTATARMHNGEIIVTHVEVHLSHNSMAALGRIQIDGTTTFSRRWTTGALIDSNSVHDPGKPSLLVEESFDE